MRSVVRKIVMPYNKVHSMKKLLNFGIVMLVAYFFIGSVQSIYAGTCRRCSNSYGCQIAKFETSSPINADGGCDAYANPIGTVERLPAMASYSNSGGSCTAKGDGSQGAGASPYFNNMCYEAPIGYIDSITCDSIKGWTCDPNNANTPGGDVQIPIHIYNGSNYVTWDVAYRDRSDVPNAGFCGKWTNAMNGAHGFELQLPASLRDNQPHTIYVYGINQGPGGNTNLPSAATGSPGITIQCAPQTYACPSRCSTRYGCTMTGPYQAYDNITCNSPATTPPYSPTNQDICTVSTDPAGHNNNCVAPSAPTNMTGSCVANGAGGYNAVFTWNQVTTPVAGVTYKISVNGGTQISTGTTNSYTMPGAVLGQVYSWNILPTAKSGFPAASATAGTSFTCIGTPPAAPASLGQSCTATTLTYTFPAPPANVNYTLTYTETNAQGLITNTVRTGLTGTTLSVTGNKGSTYTAKIVAVNAQSQQSGATNTSSAVACAPLIKSFVTNPLQPPALARNGNTTLVWTSAGVTGTNVCNIPDLCGASTTNYCLDANGSKSTVNQSSGSLLADRTYTLTCKNGAGSDARTLLVQVENYVGSPPTPFEQSPGLVFSAAYDPIGGSRLGDGLLSKKLWLVGPTANGNGNPKFTPDRTDQPLALSYQALSKAISLSGQTTTSLPAICSTNCPKGVYVLDPAAATVSLGNITVNGDKTQPVIILAKGNVTITGTIKITNADGFFLLASGGDITVANTIGTAPVCGTAPGTPVAGELQGVFSSHGSFIVDSKGVSGTSACEAGTPDLMLHIDGTIITNAALGFDTPPHTGGKLENRRDLCADNFNFPAIRIVQRPQLVLSAPEFVKPQKTTFQEIAP